MFSPTHDLPSNARTPDQNQFNIATVASSDDGTRVALGASTEVDDLFNFDYMLYAHEHFPGQPPFDCARQMEQQSAIHAGRCANPSPTTMVSDLTGQDTSLTKILLLMRLRPLPLSRPTFTHLMATGIRPIS